MSNVYFIPLTEYDETNLSLQLRRLLETVIDKEQVRLADEIPLKVHFGERGNTTYIKPGCYQGVIDYLNENDVKSRFIETNVLYRGARTTRESHIALAEEHGFTQLPITIADGHHGEDVLRVPIEAMCLMKFNWAKHLQILINILYWLTLKVTNKPVSVVL